MQNKRKIFAYAKKLLSLSLQDGEVSAARVTAILATMRAKPPRDVKAVLRVYAKLIKRAIAEQTVAVESAVALDASLLTAISAYFSQEYARPVTAQIIINPSLIAGLRARIGDDLYDASISGRLARLAVGVR